MLDLNDLYFFAEVVTHGGYTAAARALRQPKSKLSRRVADLEARLGVRLIERSTRQFRVTDIGRAYYEQCRSVMLEVERAEAVVAAAQGEPHGIVRFSCPTGLIDVVSSILPAFTARYPRVKLNVVATNRRIDLIQEHIDVALRVRTTLDSDAALTMRTLGVSRHTLVASPALANTIAIDATPADLAGIPTLSPSEEIGEESWTLLHPDGSSSTVRHEPRLSCGDLGALRDAAAAGLGVALLPERTTAKLRAEGQLVRVLAPWHSRDGIVHVVFTTRRGLPPSVRAWIDHLAEQFRNSGWFTAEA